jgi:hypothetical protein
MNNKWTSRQRGMSRLVLLSTILIAAGHAHAATVPVTAYVVINPITVCDTAGPSGPTGCAPFNNQSVSPNPAQATASTPIGFVDPATNVNVTRAIWLQMGIDVTFLPIQEVNNTTYETINDIACGNTSCTSLASPLFKTLSTPPGPTKATGCKSNCTVPFPSSKANAINMFFVDQISGVGGSLAGFAWLNGNGVAISSGVFSFSSSVPSRFDTLAHELGHNLVLDHTTFGAGSTCSSVPSPSGCNLMDAGTMREVPTSSGCSTSGALFDLDTGLCGTSVPTVPQADQLILGTKQCTATTPSQQCAIMVGVPQFSNVPSGFLNSIPNVNATAGGGDVSFTVNFPKLKTTNGKPGEYIFAIVLALPQGFAFRTPGIFVPTGGTGGPNGTGPTVFGFEVLNGNNGQGNENCVKPISGGPSIECLEADFDPEEFTEGASITFTSNIINKSTGQEATLGELTGTDLTLVFSDLLATSSALVFRDKSGNLSSNSQLPDPTVTSVIVDPSNFPSVAALGLTLTGPVQPPILCTSDAFDHCPDKLGGNWLFTKE